MLKALITMGAAVLAMTAAHAQMTPAPAKTGATPTPTMTATRTSTSTKKTVSTTKAAVPRTAVSLDCSKQADAKNLHGGERKSFREKCKRAGGKS